MINMGIKTGTSTIYIITGVTLEKKKRKAIIVMIGVSVYLNP